MLTVSVVTPCYNAARFIERTMGSVCAQTFGDWEYVIVDDGSKDDSAAVVAEWIAKKGLGEKIRLVRQPNGDKCRACNAGVRHASPGTKYLYFLDADDMLEPEALSRMVGYMEAHGDVGMLHCRHRSVDGDDRDLAAVDFSVWPWVRLAPDGDGIRTLADEEAETPFASIFLVGALFSPQMFYRREAFEAAGGFDDAFGNGCDDTDLALRVALKWPVHLLPEVLVRYRVHGAQWSADPARFQKKYDMLNEKWRKCEGHTPAEKEVVEAAWRFREGVFKPWRARQIAGAYLRQGRLLKAGRMWMQARGSMTNGSYVLEPGAMPAEAAT